MGVREGFDRLIAGLDAPVAVVTTAGGDERAGCLIGFHCQCSIEPSRYALWLSKANHTFRVALLADHLAVHLLSEGDHDLAALFGEETGDDVDKFARVGWSAGEGGVPLLDRVPRRLVGRKLTLLDDGSDHVCIVIEPVTVDAPDDEPFEPLRLHAVTDLEAGHEATERQQP